MLFESADDNLANFAYNICTIPMVPIVLFYLFHRIDKTQFKERGIVAILIIIFTAKLLNYLAYMLSAPFGLVVFMLTMFITYLSISMAWTWKAEVSDKIEKHGTYFVFKRPKSMLDFVITFFRSPVSSFSIVQDEKWYKFSRAYSGLYASDMKSIDLNCYILKRVRDIDNDILKSLVGTRWRMISNNCITAFQPVLYIVGIKLKYFDFIPAIFAHKFFSK